MNSLLIELDKKCLKIKYNSKKDIFWSFFTLFISDLNILKYRVKQTSVPVKSLYSEDIEKALVIT
jgi:hypothetical protein